MNDRGEPCTFFCGAKFVAGGWFGTSASRTNFHECDEKFGVASSVMWHENKCCGTLRVFSRRCCMAVVGHR